MTKRRALIVFLLAVVLPLWLGYRLGRWVLRMAFWSGVGSQL